MTVYLVVSVPKMPYIHRIYMVLANLSYGLRNQYTVHHMQNIVNNTTQTTNQRATHCVQHKLCNTNCATRHAHHTTYNTPRTTQNVQHKLCNTTCTPHHVHHTVHILPHTTHYVQHSVYDTKCATQIVQHDMHTTPRTTHHAQSIK